MVGLTDDRLCWTYLCTSFIECTRLRISGTDSTCLSSFVTDGARRSTFSPYDTCLNTSSTNATCLSKSTSSIDATCLFTSSVDATCLSKSVSSIDVTCLFTSSIDTPCLSTSSIDATCQCTPSLGRTCGSIVNGISLGTSGTHSQLYPSSLQL
jgi:hypothetical protein